MARGRLVLLPALHPALAAKQEVSVHGFLLVEISGRSNSWDSNSSEIFNLKPPKALSCTFDISAGDRGRGVGNSREFDRELGVSIVACPLRPFR